ncbi:hypothetical protein E2C01_076699 [Portunus trituberculatus]|uniref:Uncharacterized protein n=1 Tax=Portunus trituberculatus TaxID=210409 RepID=A0A5B7IIA7_PORTR|nr:hypothetical protein [Portunus trituberculatus]
MNVTPDCRKVKITEQKKGEARKKILVKIIPPSKIRKKHHSRKQEPSFQNSSLLALQAETDRNGQKHFYTFLRLEMPGNTPCVIMVLIGGVLSNAAVVCTA